MTWNTTARFFAGLPVSEKDGDTFFMALISDAWLHHAHALDQLFQNFTLRHAEPFHTWSEAILGKLARVPAVFYPFSGPDIVFPHLLYRGAETYLLCGLESCDLLPDWKALSPESLKGALKALTGSIRHFLEYSYFITKDMKTGLQASCLHGVLPVFLVFLARTGHVVHAVTPVSLDPRGNPISTHTGASAPQGLRIRFQGKGEPQCLYYFQQDLRDEHCAADSPFYHFAASLGRPAAFVKSASYLLHEPNFSHVRDFIFQQCSSLVQDPSSLPFRSFASRGWKIQLHGRYSRTLPVFQRYEQPDLAEAYTREGNNSAPLPFGIGYHTEAATASLQVALPGLL